MISDDYVTHYCQDQSNYCEEYEHILPAESIASGVAAAIAPAFPTASITPFNEANSFFLNQTANTFSIGIYMAPRPRPISTLPSRTVSQESPVPIKNAPNAAINKKMLTNDLTPYRSAINPLGICISM